MTIEALEPRRLLSVSLVKDIHPITTAITTASNLANINGTLYFTAGSRLWKTDGTANAAVQVSTTLSSPTELTNVNGTLYCISGGRLWKSDGTQSGTAQVSSAVSGVKELTVVNGMVFFQGSDGGGIELWKSDGTSAGTVRVKDINPGAVSSEPKHLRNVNGTLFFRASDGATGYELWKSDGTDAGTMLVEDILPGSDSSSIASLTNVNGTLFFSANDGVSGYEVWKSDGSEAGTVRVADINPGAYGSSPASLRNVNGTLYFIATDAATGYELWKSNGTAGGTTLVKDIIAGSGSASLYYPTEAGGKLYFVANDGSGMERWISDGSSAGTQRVKDIRAGAIGSDPSQLINVNGTLYFRANEGTGGYELWKSNGADAGTQRVADIIAGSGSSSPAWLTNVNGTVYFTGTDADGSKIFKSDGTSGGTFFIQQMTSSFNPSSAPSNLTNINGTLFFTANDGINGNELWKSDGTTAGTIIVKDIVLGAGSSSPSLLTQVNGTLFFVSASRLWKSDGSDAGTVQVSSLALSPTKLTNVNGTLFFAGSDSAGQELWKSNGTSAGTVRVKDIAPGSSSGNLNWLTNVNGTLFFTAHDGTSGEELWKSNGTATGTVLVKDIVAGLGSSGPYLLTAVGSTLFFRATDGASGYELWKSDGTPGGTMMVKDVLPGPGNSGIDSLTNVNGTLYFSATDGINGRELWKSDGSAAGTLMVADIYPGPHGSSPAAFVNANGTLFFRADEGVNGLELWKSDGTPGGTGLVKDVRSGDKGSGPFYLVASGSRVYFLAFTGGTYLLFSSDGTGPGTVSEAGDPWWLTDVNGVLFFQGSGSGAFSELFKANPVSAESAAINPRSVKRSKANASQLISSSTKISTSESRQQAARTAVSSQELPMIAAADSPEPGYRIYNSTYNPEGYVNTIGFDGIYVNGSEMWLGDAWAPEKEVPDEAKIRALARRMAALDDPLVLDLEHMATSVQTRPTGLVQSNVEKIAQMIDWIHDEEPGVKVGLYALLPAGDYGGFANPTPHGTWEQADAYLQPLYDRVDFIAPSLYTYADGWQQMAESTLGLASSYGKPVFSFIWMRYHPIYAPSAHYPYIPGDVWSDQLRTTTKFGDDTVIWEGGGVWDEDYPWWAVTKDFLISPQRVPPEAPASVQPAAVSSTRIDLTWTPGSSNAAEFTIERSFDGVNFTPVAVAGASQNSYSNTNAIAGVIYHYRVRASNLSGAAVSSAVTVTTLAPPQSLAPAGVTSARVDLSWTDASSGESGFKIERSSDGVAFSEVGAADGASNFSDYSVSPSTSFLYRVRAYNAQGYSSYSNVIAVQTTAPPSNGVAGFWRLDDGAGTTGADSSANAFNGLLENGAAWTTGTLGGAVSFDGIDDRVRITDSAHLRFGPSQSFSLSVWVNLAAPPNRRMGVVTKSAGAAPAYGLWIDDANRWVFGGTSEIIGPAATTGWTHVALVQDGPAGTRTMFVNGNLVATGAAQAANGQGELWLGGSQGAGEYFAGTLDDARIYGRALTGADVSALANPNIILAGDGASDSFTIRLDALTGTVEFFDRIPTTQPPSFIRAIDTIGSIQVIGGGADDLLNLEFIGGMNIAPYSFIFDGQTGSDTLSITGSLAGDPMTVNGSSLVRGPTVVQSANERLDLQRGVFTFSSDANGAAIEINDDASAIFQTTQHLASLSLNGGTALLAPGGGKIIHAASLFINAAGGASLDLTDNAMIVSGATLDEIEPLIRLGFNSGDWLGGGLGSSSAANDPSFVTALGYLDNRDAGFLEFEGETGLSGQEVLIKYTRYGDADLNGTVNLDDFNEFLFGYNNGQLAGAPRATWLTGDFDLNGSVNLDDFNQFLFGFQAPPA